MENDELHRNQIKAKEGVKVDVTSNLNVEGGEKKPTGKTSHKFFSRNRKNVRNMLRKK